MDGEFQDNVKVVEDGSAPEPVTDSPQQQATQTATTLDYSDLESELRDISESVNQTNQDIDVLSAKMQDGIGNVTTRLDAIERGQSEMAADVNETRGDDGNATVQIDSAQWQQMRESWLWAKDCASLALFLVLVASLFVAALLGTKLWEGFSKGWRR